MNRVLSGVQPTGNLTIGNYLGAIRNWIGFQKDYECLFCVVDLHAWTTPQDPKELLYNTRQVAATYIACGIDVSKSFIFVQSHVSAHAELAWLLNCVTPLGWLNRMTQFKDKAGKNKDKANLGLYAYPVLMAADILLYKTTHVPVGEDQKQHLELTRDIAQSFNHTFSDTFVLPEPMILGQATRVMSLRDGTSKMSKSDPSDMSRINLMDNEDLIRQKIKKAKSDSNGLPDNIEDLKLQPEALNLMTIFAELSKVSLEVVCNRFGGKMYSELKTQLADVVVENICPIGKKVKELMEDIPALDAILQRGAGKANQIAIQTLREVKDKMGFLSL